MANIIARKLANFVRLDEGDTALLDEVVAKSYAVPDATDLIREGDKPSDVFAILAGMACRYKTLPDGRRQIMAYLVPGDVGDLQVFLLDHMDHSLATLSDCTVARLPRSSVLALLDRPRLAQGFLLSTMVDEGTLREWVMNVGRRLGDERVAHLLCELLVRLNAVGLVTDDGYSFPITQVELADTVGLSAVHLNRVLQGLRKAGLIKLAKSRVKVLDVRGLQKLAAWNPNYLHLQRFTPKGV